ncbi:MAG: holo-ACP synthase, partial [Acidimicrobiaceae bacterium]
STHRADQKPRAQHQVLSSSLLGLQNEQPNWVHYLHDVSIRNSESGSPELIVTGRAAVLAQSRGVKNWLVSLSHTEDTAIAVVASN